MKKRSLLPSDHTYSSLFAACAEAGPKASTILDKVQDEIERRSVMLNNISTNALITALASCGRHDDALGIYSDMFKRNMNPDLHTFGALLLVAAGDRDGGFEVAQRVWSEIIASGMNPDLHCFNVLLQCVRGSGVNHSNTESVNERRSVSVTANLDFTADNLANQRHDLTNIELRVTGVTNFTLGQGSRLKVHLGHVEGRRKEPPLRWLEVEDVELLFALFKSLKLRPEIRTFHLLAHLCLDPSLLVRKMGKRKILPDSRFVVAAIKMQAQLGNLAGAKVHNYRFFNFCINFVWWCDIKTKARELTSEIKCNTYIICKTVPSTLKTSSFSFNFLIFTQHLLKCANRADINLDQAGYQAVGTCCLKEEEGVKLLDEMKVSAL